MLIARYLIKETIKSQVAVFFILMAIFVTLRFVRVLGDASDGDIPAGLVAGFLALYTPILASLVLPISAFLGVMLAHGRLYVDSEMTVLRACGVSEWYVARVMLVLSLVVMSITAVTTFYLAPLAAESEYSLREKASSEAGLTALVPGRFQQTGNQQAVIFAHDIDTSSDSLQRVFLSQKQNDDDRVRVVYASSGEVQSDIDGTRYLILRNGNQYEGSQGQADFRVLTFDEYKIQISEQSPEQERTKMSVLSTKDLWQQNSDEGYAELQWRLAIPLSIPLLMLVAVPLATVNPRQGRFGKIFPGILLYLGYFLLLLASKRVMEEGKLPPELGLWWVHFVVLLIAMGLLVRERKTGSWLRSLITRRVS
ncbi:LPS export ABC transporter permease LptF [Alteromonas sediminis]|uniref:Lipopolysaccharide export system permease protein LptF n=1 Tax=Alteromonas sediminis TaxID=2259342 RepID=A0A3N5Y056_9ALTE|nr:LPS export ABC transporter permease LptF [Alteromonas sediminis]RPJ65796.1 LPS export ABC transporter permease LptF [Alteromonas sediminis]